MVLYLPYSNSVLTNEVVETSERENGIPGTPDGPLGEHSRGFQRMKQIEQTVQYSLSCQTEWLAADANMAGEMNLPSRHSLQICSGR